jgi:hypothetical protein
MGFYLDGPAEPDANPHGCGFPDRPCSSCEAAHTPPCCHTPHLCGGPHPDCRDVRTGDPETEGDADTIAAPSGDPDTVATPACHYCDESDYEYCAIHRDRQRAVVHQRCGCRSGTADECR